MVPTYVQATITMMWRFWGEFWSYNSVFILWFPRGFMEIYSQWRCVRYTKSKNMCLRSLCSGLTDDKTRPNHQAELRHLTSCLSQTTCLFHLSQYLRLSFRLPGRRSSRFENLCSKATFPRATRGGYKNRHMAEISFERKTRWRAA